jgi:hypothetical protein
LSEEGLNCLGNIVILSSTRPDLRCSNHTFFSFCSSYHTPVKESELERV